MDEDTAQQLLHHNDQVKAQALLDVDPDDIIGATAGEYQSTAVTSQKQCSKDIVMSASSVSEEYRQHPVYSDYWFSNLGNVYSVKRGKRRALVGTRCSGLGYRAIAVKGAKKIYVHRAVCELFNGPCPEGFQCRHLDGDIENNAAANLAWGSAKENNTDKRRHGTLNLGEANPMSKLTKEAVRKMRDMREKTGDPYSKIAKVFGVSTMTAHRAINRRSWK